MLSIEPGSVSTKELHGYLLGATAPRPIAFASTIDKDGKPNLAPFSYFNVFSSNPPILVFSPSSRVRDNTLKHTLENVKAVKEVVINIVDYNMTYQMVLASTEYAKGVSEFSKAGFTPVKSEKIKAFRVKESPVQFECKVLEIKSLGKDGGAGNLVICEVVMIHINEAILNEKKLIDPYKLDPVSRLGGKWYSRANQGLFEINGPSGTENIGFDGMPDSVRNSKVLSGNDLGKLGMQATLPSRASVQELAAKDEKVKSILSEKSGQIEEMEEALHHYAKSLMEADDIMAAWQALFVNKLNMLR